MDSASRYLPIDKKIFTFKLNEIDKLVEKYLINLLNILGQFYGVRSGFEIYESAYNPDICFRRFEKSDNKLLSRACPIFDKFKIYLNQEFIPFNTNVPNSDIAIETQDLNYYSEFIFPFTTVILRNHPNQWKDQKKPPIWYKQEDFNLTIINPFEEVKITSPKIRMKDILFAARTLYKEDDPQIEEFKIIKQDKNTIILQKKFITLYLI
jgi:hypothetical protein